MENIVAKFVGIDMFNRPVFKSAGGTYYCWTDKLYADHERPTQEELDAAGLGATNKGDRFDGEPSHFVKNVQLVLE